MKLIKYRDAESADYVFFWVNEKEVQVSPTFASENEAIIWTNK